MSFPKVNFRFPFGAWERRQRLPTSREIFRPQPRLLRQGLDGLSELTLPVLPDNLPGRTLIPGRAKSPKSLHDDSHHRTIDFDTMAISKFFRRLPSRERRRM